MADLYRLRGEQMPDDFRKGKRFAVMAVAAAVVAVGLIALAVITYMFNNRCYRSYQVESEVDRSDSNNVVYSYFNGNILKCSRSGISAINSDGKSLWNGGFEMKQPQVDTCKNFVVAADVTGKSVCIYNGNDEGETIQTTLPIVRAKVAGQGVVAVMLEDTDSNVLNIYNPYSNADSLLVEIPTNVSEEGYPLDFDISEDGKSVVIAYMAVNGNSVENRVNFYNFTEVGQDQNTLVGGKSYGENMISEIDFVGEDEVAIFFENGFSLFRGMKQPEILTEKTFEEEIESIALSDKYIAVVTKKGEGDTRTLQLFNLKGKQQMKREISYEFSEMKIYNDEIFFITNLDCHILRVNGHEKFVCNFDGGIDTIFPTSNRNKYMLLRGSKLQRIAVAG